MGKTLLGEGLFPNTEALLNAILWFEDDGASFCGLYHIWLDLHGFSEDPGMVCREQAGGDLELFLKELEKWSSANRKD